MAFPSADFGRLDDRRCEGHFRKARPHLIHGIPPADPELLPYGGRSVNGVAHLCATPYTLLEFREGEDGERIGKIRDRLMGRSTAVH